MRLRSFIFLPAALALWAAQAEAATVPVTNTNDNLAGSLREAIGPGSSAGDTIVFQIPTSDPGYSSAANTFTITLTSGELAVNKDLTIDAGRQKIVIQRSSAVNTPNFRIFNVTAGTVTIANMTIANGLSDSTSGGKGGGIRSAGNLTLRGCTLSGNTATLQGGGLYSSGTAVITNCTFIGNGAAGEGGAILDGGSLTLKSSTIVGNTANSIGGGVTTVDAVAPHVGNTVIAGNSGGDPPTAVDLVGSFISDGYNFIGTNPDGSGFGNSGSHDQVGTSGAPANPQLGALQDNGGPTLTMRPLTGSPVIDQGNSGGVTTDQRGFPRPVDQPGIANVGDGSDIGAVETGLPQTGPTFTVTNTSAHYDGSCTNDDCTFVEALTASNATPGNNTINFAAGVTGTIYTTSASGLFISNPVTINGPGARALNILSVGSGGRVFLINASNVAISGLSISNGLAQSDGGGIAHSGGVLALTDCTIAGNFTTTSATNGGGGIFNASGATLTLLRCTLSGNGTPRLGGGVYNDGIFTATNCTFQGDSALRGGGIISRFNGGAATMTVRNCTITGCTANSTGTGAGDGGGGVYAEGSDTQHHVGNTIIAKNSTGGVNPDVRGNFTADTVNFIGDVGDSTGLIGLAFIGDPSVGPLQNNGGPTDTVPLLSDSRAIDNGDDSLAPPTDQRGYLRSGTSDIGAFEFGGTLPVLKITSITHLANGHISLQGLGIPNTVHTIQASSDPNAGSFTFLGTGTSNGTGVLQYDDAGAVGLRRRFYRLTFP